MPDGSDHGSGEFWAQATANREVVKAIAYAIDRSTEAVLPKERRLGESE